MFRDPSNPDKRTQLEMEIEKLLQEALAKENEYFASLERGLSSVDIPAPASIPSAMLLSDKADKASSRGKSGAMGFFQKSLQTSFLKCINPIASSILNVCIELYNADLMNEEQRKEFTKIGSEISAVPFKVLSREMDLQQGMTAVGKGFDKLAKFLNRNRDLVGKVVSTVGTTLLKDQLGPFIKVGLGALSKAGIDENLQRGLFEGLKELVKGSAHLEKIITLGAELLAKPGQGSK